MSIRQFITSFLNRKGGQVLFSFFFSKLSRFLIAIVIINLLPKSEYGFIVYALSILSFLMPLMGAGIPQGLARYGSLSDSQRQKKYLLQQAMKKGLLASAVLVVVLLCLVPILTKNVPQSAFYLAVISFQLLAMLVYHFVSVYSRLLHLNHIFAQIENVHNVLLTISTIVMCYLFGGAGYVFSLVLVPLSVGLYYMYRLRLWEPVRGAIEGMKIDFKEYISYGLSVSIGGLLSQMLYTVDILLLGNILANSEELIAQYKAATIFPFSLLFIPVAIIATDYVKLARAAIKDPQYLKQYYLNYLKLFTGVAILIFLFFYFFGEYLLGLFGKDYQQVPELMVIFAAGVVGGLLFRVPLGNILSAIGLPKVNAMFSAIILLMNVAGSYLMIQRHGILGAAYVTAALMWLSGLFSLGAFYWFLKKKVAHKKRPCT
ncbi:MAG TPA: hypothetical protein ENJ45_05625 [Phaeodactylibacter sp.]|nr:hypothetical protein [Phaeodactylibacter sp.]